MTDTRITDNKVSASALAAFCKRIDADFALVIFACVFLGTLTICMLPLIAWIQK